MAASYIQMELNTEMNLYLQEQVEQKQALKEYQEVLNYQLKIKNYGNFVNIVSAPSQRPILEMIIQNFGLLMNTYMTGNHGMEQQTYWSISTEEFWTKEEQVT